MNTREILILKALESKHSQYTESDAGRQIVDKLFESDTETADKLTKNVCARISLPLAHDMEHLCRLLGLSKREFITMSINDMVEKSTAVLHEFDAMPQPATTEE